MNGVLGNIAELYYPAKAFLRRFHAIISDPRLSYQQGICLNAFLGGDIDLWIHFLSNPLLSPIFIPKIRIFGKKS